MFSTDIAFSTAVWRGASFPAGLRFDQAIHECRAPGHTAGHAAFAAWHLAGLPVPRPILWISAVPSWYPPGLAWVGLEPSRCLFAQGRDDAECLSALEVALRSGMAGVAECGNLSRLSAKRLALAAKHGNSVGFLLRHVPAVTPEDSTAFATRWMISPVRGSRLRAELLYAKGGQPGLYLLNTQEDENVAAPPAIPLVPQNTAEERRRAG